MNESQGGGTLESGIRVLCLDQVDHGFYYLLNNGFDFICNNNTLCLQCLRVLQGHF